MDTPAKSVWGLRWCAACGEEVLAIWGTCPVCDGPLSDRPAPLTVRVGRDMRWCAACGTECATGETQCPVCDGQQFVPCAEIKFLRAGDLVVAA